MKGPIDLLQIFIVFTLYYATLLVGWILDLIFADPASKLHPMALFGRLIAKGEISLNKGKYKRIKGAFMSICLIALACIIGVCIEKTYDISIWLGLILKPLTIFFCIAGTTLIREVKQVFDALDNSIEDGRRQVGRIVGRDTGELTENEIRTASLETLSENLSDGVIAPIFWYTLLGLPGILGYKMINTLDSMIGYRTERYKQFGFLAAKIDDLANLIPARLTALIMLIAAGMKINLIPFVIKYGKQHASPNSGYPEAALAAILNCRFGGGHHYFGQYFYKPYIGENQRELDNRDLKKAIQVNRISEAIVIVSISAFQCFCFL